ncbi:hypothetical protein [uncultured Algibacter sp.]|uniref:OB-fold protein n=1 Tax=uncultured Algibacter sp. TaxID=298659 RepID=UPI002622F046|nr:hypothetical protein [uncultured Algibacter sp.]
MKRAIITLSVVIIATLCYARYQYNKPKQDVLSTNSDYSFSAIELIEKFNQDENVSTVFFDKIITVSGKISLIEKGTNTSILILNDGIKCEIDNSDPQQNLTEGMNIIIKGIFSGYDDMFNEIALVKCVIIE